MELSIRRDANAQQERWPVDAGTILKMNDAGPS